MSRRIFLRLTQASAAVGLGIGSLIGYKAYKKSIKYPPNVRYPINEDIKLEKSKVEYNLKSREDHLKEAIQTDYDILIIGSFCLFC